MSFCWSTLLVRNLQESIKFYQDIVGLSISEQFTTDDGKEIVFLGDGDTKIEIIYDKNNKDIEVGKSISWGFIVDSIEERMNYVKSLGIKIEEGPYQPNPFIKFFFILDPNGLRIQLVENIK